MSGLSLTYGQRLEHCNKNFWTVHGVVVVRCKECSRHQMAAPMEVVGIDGKLKLAMCESCRTLTCRPILKDRKTVAEVTT